MKNNRLLAVLVLTLAASGLQAQVYMKVSASTGNSPSNNKNIQLISFRDSGSNAVVTNSGRSQGGRAATEITVKMVFDPAVEDFRNDFAEGRTIADVQFQFMGRNGNANVLKYTVGIKGAVITGFKLFTLDNNPTLYEEVRYAFQTATYTPAAGNTK